MKRKKIANYIVSSLQENKEELVLNYADSKSNIGYFYIDNLLPEEIVNQVYTNFPSPEKMVLKSSLKEQKYVSAQMDNHDPILEEIIFAFQDSRVVALISEICGIKNIYPDKNLYAGGISMMGQNHFLNPHLDNSHDKNRERWRVLNLLFYVTPDWKIEYGGNLELWPNGLKSKPIEIHSKQNRLVVMATHNQSLHSVNKVVHDGIRCCVSNYYFSDEPLNYNDSFHVTSFRDRIENSVTDTILQIDNFLRMSVRKIFKKGIKENPHYYKKKNH